MSIQYDDNGKYFTDTVATQAIAAELATASNRVRGFVHLRHGDRLKDELERPQAFLAVTDAIVFGWDGSELFRAGFLALNRALIVWAAPSAEASREEEA